MNSEKDCKKVTIELELTELIIWPESIWKLINNYLYGY